MQANASVEMVRESRGPRQEPVIIYSRPQKMKTLVNPASVTTGSFLLMSLICCGNAPATRLQR